MQLPIPLALQWPIPVPVPLPLAVLLALLLAFPLLLPQDEDLTSAHHSTPHLQRQLPESPYGHCKLPPRPFVCPPPGGLHLQPPQSHFPSLQKLPARHTPGNLQRQPPQSPHSQGMPPQEPHDAALAFLFQRQLQPGR